MEKSIKYNFENHRNLQNKKWQIIMDFIYTNKNHLLYSEEHIFDELYSNNIGFGLKDLTEFNKIITSNKLYPIANLNYVGSDLHFNNLIHFLFNIFFVLLNSIEYLLLNSFCLVCFNNLYANFEKENFILQMLPCYHVYCKKCLLKVKQNNKCIICNLLVTKIQHIYYYNAENNKKIFFYEFLKDLDFETLFIFKKKIFKLFLNNFI